MTWLPIVTAPRQEWVLVSFRDGLAVAMLGREAHIWHTNLTGNDDATVEIYPDPTHWMPLPPTPDRSGEAAKTGTGLANGESGTGLANGESGLPEGSST